MIDLSTTYMGIKLKNPIIIGSSGLTNSVEKIKKLEDNNAAAVVIKSLFEEQIIHESDVYGENSSYYDYPESHEYVKYYSKEHSVRNYLHLIQDAKKAVDIPIIASINCISAEEWITFAKKIEEAGADALELNISLLPSNEKYDSTANEKKYFNISKKVRSQINIPISLKMCKYSSGLANLVQKLSWTKNVDSFVLFNRFYSPDINIDKFKITSSNVFSTPQELTTSLRWIALLSPKIENDLVAATGIHDGKGVIKQILAGAQAVQIVSAIYNKGPEYIQSILGEVEAWMTKHNYSNLDEFRSKMNSAQVKNPAAFERTQFMKYFGGIE